MLIHAIDPGQRSGFAIGPAGEVPNSGGITLRKPKEPREIGLSNMDAYLEDVWRRRKPDILVYEPAMSLAAWSQNAKRNGGRFHSSEAIESAIELAAIIKAKCCVYGIRLEAIHRSTVMSQITGRVSWGVEGMTNDQRRKENKAAVLRALLKMRMLPPECRDDNRADAVAMHIVASGKFAKCKPLTIGIFENL